MRSAVVAAVGFIGLAAFQLALALGAPLGEAAYGGTQTNPSVGLRITSAFAVILWVAAALVVLRRGGYRVPLITARVSRIGTWVLVGLLPLGALMNFASSSEWERFGWGPIGLLLTVLCFVVARGGGRSGRDLREG